MDRKWQCIGLVCVGLSACSAASMPRTAASPAAPGDLTQLDSQEDVVADETEAPVAATAPLGCAEVVESDDNTPVLQMGAPGSSGAAARYYREQGSLDEDRGFGSARQLLQMVGAQRQLSVPASPNQTDRAALDLTIDFVHHPLRVSGERWSSFWVVESTPPGVTPHLAVPVCLVVRSADHRIAQQWNAEILTSDEPGRAVLTVTAALETPDLFRAPVGQTCSRLDVQLDMRAEATRASINVTTNARQSCASWGTERRPVLSAEGLPGPEDR